MDPIKAKAMLKRLMLVDEELRAISTLYSDFKSLNYTKHALRMELSTLRDELRAEYEQLTADLTGVEVEL